MNPYPIQDNASFEALPGTVKAGVPSSTDDFREKLDLVKLMVRHSGMDPDVSIVILGYMERWDTSWTSIRCMPGSSSWTL